MMLLLKVMATVIAGVLGTSLFMCAPVVACWLVTREAYSDRRLLAVALWASALTTLSAVLFWVAHWLDGGCP